MNLQRCFLVVGESKPPEVHLLSAPEVEFLNARLQRAQTTGVASVRSQVLVQTFGEGTEQLFPCWSKPHMQAVALQYEGAHEDEMRRIAACISLGRPYSLDDGPGSNDDDGGGKKARLDPPKPIKPRPGGTAFADVKKREPVPVGAPTDEPLRLKPRKRR
jgi:hypothetical protein